MFFEDGWVPLSEVTSTVFRRLQGFAAAGPEGAARSLQADLAISVWDICEAASKIAVTGGDGQAIPASKDLVAWADPVSLTNEHVNLRDGNVGSSTMKPADGAPPGEAELRVRYGSFLYSPVVLPVNNVQSSLTFLEEELNEQKKNDPLVHDAARAIAADASAGKLVTRETARQAYGAALSRRKLKIAWALASRERPELREPRRWQGL